jgi:hypothetical protein
MSVVTVDTCIQRANNQVEANCAPLCLCPVFLLCRRTTGKDGWLMVAVLCLS